MWFLFIIFSGFEKWLFVQDNYYYFVGLVISFLYLYEL